MPFKNGLETTQEVQELFRSSNKYLSEGTLADKVSIMSSKT